ncbi:MAG: hypothetical protein ACW99A_09720 [Candidatus Kariarchaeaceae archaeon]|jgi:hypothetical protein
MCDRCDFTYCCFKPCCQVVGDNLFPSIRHIEILVEAGQFDKAELEIKNLKGNEQIIGRILLSRIRRLQGKFTKSADIMTNILQKEVLEYRTQVIAQLEMATLLWHENRFVQREMPFFHALKHADQGLQILGSKPQTTVTKKLTASLFHLKGYIHRSLFEWFVFHRAYIDLNQTSSVINKLTFDDFRSIDETYQSLNKKFEDYRQYMAYISKKTKELQNLIDKLKGKKISISESTIISDAENEIRKYRTSWQRLLKMSKQKKETAPSHIKAIKHKKYSNIYFRSAYQIRKNISDIPDLLISYFTGYMMDRTNPESELIIKSFDFIERYDRMVQFARLPSSISMKRLAAILFVPLHRSTLLNPKNYGYTRESAGKYIQSLLEEIGNQRDTILIMGSASEKIDFIRTSDPESQILCNVDWIPDIYQEVAKEFRNEKQYEEAMKCYIETLLFLEEHHEYVKKRWFIATLSDFWKTKIKSEYKELPSLEDLLDDIVSDCNEVQSIVNQVEQASKNYEVLYNTLYLLILLSDPDMKIIYLNEIIKHVKRINTGVTMELAEYESR